MASRAKTAIATPRLSHDEKLATENLGSRGLETREAKADEGGVPGWFAFVPASVGRSQYALLLFGVICQLVTIGITWPLWQIRISPPHLPTWDLPQWPFGWLMVASLVLVAAKPRWGVPVHWGVLIVACVWDQFRMQPQFFSIAVLMTACVWDAGRRVARWTLVSTWLWAGLHKLLSPDWFGYASHWVVARSGFDADSTYFGFALGVAVVELAVGLLAIFRPKWAAPACLVMHVGIALMISPVVLNWNESVLPWNLSVAVIGTWVMRTTETWRPDQAWEKVVCTICLFAPIGFYGGYLDHGFSGVLYSGSLPQGLITTKRGLQPIEGWGELAVPFPSERRTLRIYFEQVAEPGAKLHLADPRPWLDDAFYVLDSDHHARPIDSDAFFAGVPVFDDSPADGFDQIDSSAPYEISGVGLDSRRSKFELQRAGVRMVRRAADEPIYAVAFTKDSFDRELLNYLPGLPNLMQIQFAGTAIQDDDLRKLLRCRLLTGIGLDHTAITDAGLGHLKTLPYLQYIECEGTEITPEGLQSVINDPLGSLE
ncbi:hypothetical protein [Aporhodopirellula aestuarii]|nr:hypothetical protein [Aporhodopirellula aestuarii]